MTKKEDKTENGHDVSIPMPFAGMANLNGSLFEAYAQAGQAFLRNAFALNQEVMRFANERFQAEMEAFQSLSQCKNWQDMAKFQSDFARSTGETYQAEISKLMERNTDAATTAWKPLYESAKSLSKGAAQE